MAKKLFFKLSDGADVSNVVMELDACVEWIKNDDINEDNSDDIQYVLEPIYLTDEEFDNLHESNI